MDIFYEQLWKCKCGFEFIARSGLLEIDQNDFGPTHCISGYHCKKCGSVKNVAWCVGNDDVREENKKLCVNQSDICDNCGTQMTPMNEPKFTFLQRAVLCPKCKKKELKYKNIVNILET